MPEVFEASHKLKLIEYGNSESVMDIVQDAKEGLMKLISKP